MILDGKSTAEAILDELAIKIKNLPKPPLLAVVLVGENTSSLSYIRQKKRFSERLGIGFQLHTFETSVTEDTLVREVEKLNTDQEISGFIVQLPLPSHIDKDRIIRAIDPRKDVDGFTPENIGELFLGKSKLTSCTPKGVMRLLEKYSISVSGKNIVIIGKSNIVGKPLSLLMMNAGATVTICHKETKDIGYFTKNADIVVVAAGKPGLLRADMIHPATVVVDVGITSVDGKLWGDADFAAIEPTSLITPVPGGVWPMTVAMLMENVYLAAINQ